ncbi:hypothetical protein ZWY2020_039240 [Hordeum vulgare]|nr:hypothetical protein ZWY2020_039240 [Hordeum vulgare]
MANFRMDDDDELFHRYDPEVLAANGIEYPPGDARMRIKWWAFLMQVEGNLTLTKMSIPSANIIRYPDQMEKAWGWWRLLPIYQCLDSDRPLYREYLCEYYLRNPPESVDDSASTGHKFVVRSAWTNENGRLIPLARKCLEMEAKFISLCKRNKIKLNDTETALSHKIKQHAQDIVDGVCEYAGAYAAAAALVCICKEAELMCERAMCGRYSSGNMTCILCNQIREHAISLMLYKGSGSIAAAAGAAMVGAAKEAKLLRENLSDLSCDEAMSAFIREEACCILHDMHTEAFGANGKNNIAAAADGADLSTRINTVGNLTCTACNGKEDHKRELGSNGYAEWNDDKENMESSNGNNIVTAAAAGVEKSTRIRALRDLTCTASSGKEDNKRTLRSNGCTERNYAKENMENVNQKTGEEYVWKNETEEEAYKEAA